MWYHFDLKLQKQTAYKLESGVAQYKYVVTIPEPIIEELGWNEGSELIASVSGRSLVMNRISSPVKQQRKVESAKMTYDQFRDKIRRALQYNDLGMTWTRLRNHLELDQVVPNNKWVRRMEKDIGLMRVKGSDGVILWRVNHAK